MPSTTLPLNSILGMLLPRTGEHTTLSSLFLFSTSITFIHLILEWAQRSLEMQTTAPCFFEEREDTHEDMRTAVAKLQASHGRKSVVVESPY